MSTTHRVGRRSRVAGTVAAVGLLLAAALTAAPAVTAAASTTPGSTPVYTAKGAAPVLTLAPLSTAAQYQADVVKATNAQRTAHGLRPMTVTSCLSSLATKWAAHLAATNTFAHQSLGPFLSNCHASTAGENIAKGNVTASDVVTLWMNSAEHRANLLNGAFTHVAIGAARQGGDWVVVQDFSD
jgi:uncharacterized protein YkwD